MRRLLALSTVVVATGLAASPAVAAPPRAAAIKLGVGMAGATLNQVTTAVTADGRIGPAPFTAWGKLVGEFCFEGTLCAWKVPGGGNVTVERNGTGSLRVLAISTSAPGWKTSKGVRPGTTVATFRARYPQAVAMTTCSIGGFGAERPGFKVGRHAFFETMGGKVRLIHVTRYTISEGC